MRQSRTARQIYKKECELNKYDTMTVTFDECEKAPEINFNNSLPYLRVAVVMKILIDRHGPKRKT